MSTVEIHKNVVDADTVQQLVDFFYTDKSGLDVRPDNISKNIDWSQNSWDKQTVKRILDQVLEPGYEVEYWMGMYRADYRKGETYFPVHADTGLGVGLQDIYKNVLIPLELPQEPGLVGTVFFENYWHGPMSKFTQAPYYKFGYDLPDKHGGKTFVEDIRELRKQIVTDPGSVKEFEVNDEFVNTLDYLIPIRATRQNAPVNDYTNVINAHDRPLPEDLRQKYFNHMTSADVHGFTFDQCYEWILGDVITWDRTQLHCTASGPTGKLFLTIFTLRK